MATTRLMMRLAQNLYVVYIIIVFDVAIIVSISMQSDGYDHLSFFKEADTYWAPAATAEDLYTQLSEYKYRELPRREIR